ncbi:MAG: acetylxylan esterase [Planctomycetes bacterium]|nr:acetylxylan esterase [Planctomycetota bacterium]
MSLTRVALIAVVAFASVAADFKDVDPNVFPKDDPRTKDLPKMMGQDIKTRMQEANLRESKAFAAVTTKEEWTKYRDARIQALRDSLGTFPEAPKNMVVKVTRELEGDGFRIHNILYESRPGMWVSANLYLPAKPPEKMPGIIIAHAHHTPKADGELQDMGMTWARSGVAVLVPDQFGYGERRLHGFNTAKDFDKPFRVGRQDYYFRYNSNLQLSAIGDSLMGWMAWDLMRGVDVLLKQPTIDKDRIILMGSVAGGGDPAGVTAALDPRISCVVPFNFGGWQPESSALENPDRDFAWFGDGYWESTRGLRGGAAGGFAHFVIVGSVAPRKVIYGHEFAWDAKTDPAWPRLQKIFGFYDAKDSLRVAHGAGTVRASGAGNTHCNHIGAVHRKMIYPALKDWFGMAIPDEYSMRRTKEELTCWTDEARAELKPKPVLEVIAQLAVQRRTEAHAKLPAEAPAQRAWAQTTWTKLLGNIEPVANPKTISGATEDVPGGTLARFALETDSGITVPLIVIRPKDAKGKLPAVVMVAQAGKQAFLRERSEDISALLKAGVVVCLVDVRGTGETKAGTGADRGSSRTSIAQTYMILGQPILGAQLRDLRTVIRWLPTRDDIDGKKLAVWGDSFAKVNGPAVKLAVPSELEQPAVSEPGGANLALLAALFEDGVTVAYARGGIDMTETFATSPYVYVPLDAVIPGPLPVGTLAPFVSKYEGTVDAQNRTTSKPASGEAAKWVIEKLRGKH